MKPLSLKLQRLGKRKVKTVKISTETEIKSLQDLLTACVTHEVNRYNDKRKAIKLLPFLVDNDITEQAIAGKVSVGDIENDTFASLDKSIEVVLQAFADGLFAVFVNDEQVHELKEELELENDTKITFLRLTFLTGTFW